MGLTLALFHSENYTDPFVREDLQQLIASLQAQLGQPSPVSTTLVQRVVITYSSGAVNASAMIPTPVNNIAECEIAFVGESPFKDGAGVPMVANLSVLDTGLTSNTVIAVARAHGKDSGGTDIRGQVVVQIISRQSGSI